MYQTRKEIEKGIIIAIINSEAFTDVAPYLSAKNFTDKTYQQIFTAAQSLYPTKSIDVITLLTEIERLFKDDGIDAVNFCYNRKTLWYAKSSIRYWCLILLQIDIKNAFKKELYKWKAERDQEDNLPESAVIEEIYLNVTEEVDILLLLEKSKIYFEKHKMSLELTKVQDFEENVAKKTLQIKKNISLDIALSNIFAIAENSPDVKHYCKKFAEAIAYMTTTNQIKSSYSTAANLL